MKLEIDSRYPIIYIPMFGAEAKALGAEMSSIRIADDIFRQLMSNTVEEPVWLTGSSGVVCGILKARGVDVREVNRTFVMSNK